MDTTNTKKYHQFKLESVRIGLVSSKKIKQWAERTLPNGKKVGQVTTSQTLNYKSLKPYPGGLFCERIFGPIKDFQCACGKKRSQIQQKYCVDCEVEYTSSRLRRYRLGYIQLAAPVTHVWYLKSTPSYIALLLDMSRKQVEAIAYCTESIKVSEIFGVYNKFEKNLIFSNNEIASEKKHFFKEAKQGKINKLGDDVLRTPKGPLDYNEVVKVRPLKFNSLINIRRKKIDKRNCPPLFNFLQKKIVKNSQEVNFLSEKKFLADFYCISRTFSAETETDWDAFISYIESIPLENDVAIPIYKNFLNRKSSKESFPGPKTDKTGAEALYLLLSQLDLVLVEKQLRHELFELNEKLYNLHNKGYLNVKKRKQIKLLVVARWKKIRRLKVVRSFRKTLTRPEWMILTVLPVLPPDLRPALPMNGNLMISDLNSLYKLVLDRNRRVKEAKEDTPETRKMRLRLLQEAVDAVIENGKGGASPVTDKANKRPLKSLADLLKGKQGRFRENLLGKRVDYSGRSVIVVGPFLKIYECGLPKEMAVALFQPFLIRQLLKKNLARTIVSAKRIISSKDSIIWELLHQILETHPVLLNRAPTLHRLNIQAFKAKLVDGKALLLHPLVCTAFNADFDGDQMGVHVPLSSKARAEAWSLMWSRNNLLSPATGQPIMLPSQDMVLGCYYATTLYSEMLTAKQKFFNDIQDIVKAYQQGQLPLHCWVWVRWNFVLENSFEKEKPLELRIDIFGNCLQIYNSFQRRYEVPGDYPVKGLGAQTVNHAKHDVPFRQQNFQYFRTTPGRVLINQMLLTTLNSSTTFDQLDFSLN